ncbi:MAG: ABC-F family ATP-binding cassette domain-containing protein [Clostridiales bacterium]|nr:ABC-F family ATP-binding cassette domain-containing protein [Clostridiales bacterium]
MIILSCKDLKKEYGTDVIFEDVTFHVQKGDKVGIVGPNGAGKTTLLRVLTGELAHEEGTVNFHPEATFGYLHQQTDIHSTRTVMEEVEAIFEPLHVMEQQLAEITEQIEKTTGEEQAQLIHRMDALREEYERKGGYTYKSEIRGILSSMAFLDDKYDQKITDLSGGEKTRLALALLLLKKPEILILDEPTNHLDIGTLSWLEQYLGAYRGTILVVSHDRYFLDRICDHILEVADHTLRSFDGNYTDYARRKKEIREEEMRRYQAFKKEKEKQEDLVRRYKQRGTEKLAKRAHSREMMLERLAREEKAQNIHAPQGQTGKMKLRFREDYKSGSDVLLIEGLAKGFGFGARRKQLFENVDLDLKRGERVCLVGANGIGKTTLLRLILGDVRPDAGRMHEGYNVKTVYYDQEQRLLEEDNTVIEEIWQDHPDLTGTELRNILGGFLFRGDDVFLPVRALSGGERARLSLLKLMMGGGNLLLLDEPTNHLDIESREVFEDALMEFPGTALIVSHDRYFLNKVPTRICELTADGLVTFLGKYDYYQEKRDELISGRKYMKELAVQGRTGAASDGEGGSSAESVQMEHSGPAAGSKEERFLKKQQEAEERRKRREKESLEQEIETLETRISEREQQMCTEEVLADLERLRALDEAVKADRERLDIVYEKWLQYE